VTELEGRLALSTVVGNFSNGLWEHSDTTGQWQQLTPLVPSQFAVNTSTTDVVAAIPSLGLWEFNGQTSVWTQLTTFQPDHIAIDSNGDVAAAFPSIGLWKYAGSWTQLATSEPSQLVMGSNSGAIVAVFSYGLWEYTTSWTQLFSASPTQIGLDTLGDVAASFSYGLWLYPSTTHTWQQLSTAVPLGFSMSNDNANDITAVFSYGTYQYNVLDGWTQLTAQSTATFAQDPVAFNGIYAGGLWQTPNLNSLLTAPRWALLTSQVPTVLASAASGSSNSNVVGSFSNGVAEYNNGSWEFLTAEVATQLAIV
jgi:hypothetical protein